MRASDYAYCSPRFLAMAHRGGSDYEPNRGKENTIFAFLNAVALGYRYIETDVQATKDGHLVCMHDDTLERVAGIKGTVADYTAAQLREILIDGTEPVPFFDDVVDALPGINLNVDMKKDATVDLLAKAIKAHGLEQRILVVSFSQWRLSRFRVLTGGKVPTGIAPMGAAWISQIPLVGTIIPSPGVAFQVPVSQSFGPLSLEVIRPSVIQRVHRLGKAVHVWTVDEADEINRLIDMGVDGIFTDRPDVLKDVLVARDMWETS